jgi:hypothetical protein
MFVDRQQKQTEEGLKALIKSFLKGITWYEALSACEVDAVCACVCLCVCVCVVVCIEAHLGMGPRLDLPRIFPTFLLPLL